MPIVSAVRRSLRTKVVIVVLVTTFIALSVATALMLTNEVDYYRSFLLDDATTQADLLARVSAPALQFDDPKAATTNLELLNNRPSIRAAAIYTPDGTIFATYSRSDSPGFPPLGPAGVRISGGTLTMFLPIVQNDERLGTVYLESTYDLADRVRSYLFILGGVMLGGMLVAGFVALWLARSVTRPVAAITDGRARGHRAPRLHAARESHDGGRDRRARGSFQHDARRGRPTGGRARRLERGAAEGDERAPRSRGCAAARRPAQGRVPRDSRSRAAQSARADGQCNRLAAGAEPRRFDHDDGTRHDRAPASNISSGSSTTCSTCRESRAGSSPSASRSWISRSCCTARSTR